ncbi:hypothetical protein PI124_g16685 [Phytophthora idaei]|nr:hypothetical protein PI125_g19879 [Phytophthora idaei]KAG3135057.1 hypothetical protein PI126_g18415 [Phytophthora idaei]KAG3238352.1 hypothetical protein PI124_g16685 [Phytophthora idaei]
MSYRFKICFKHDCDLANPSERQKDPPLIGRIVGDRRYQEVFLSILVHYRSMLYAKYDGQILKVPHPTIARETEQYHQSGNIHYEARVLLQGPHAVHGRRHE